MLSKTLIPAAARIKFAYVWNATLTPVSAGTLTYNTFRLNSLYDVDLTGAGDSVPGFSFYQQLYSHYTVVRTYINCLFEGQDTGSLGGLYISPGSAIDSSLMSSPDLFQMNPNTQYCILNGASGERIGVQRLKRTWDGRRFFGPGFKVGEDSFKGTATTNPTEGAFLHVCAGSTHDAHTAASATQIWLRLTFIAELSEPKSVIP